MAGGFITGSCLIRVGAVNKQPSGYSNQKKKGERYGGALAEKFDS